MVPIKTKLAHRRNHGGTRSTSAIKYIVLHYTANDGDSAYNNAEYYANNIVTASAHYFVDDTTIYQSVPDNVIAWAVGGKKWSDCPQTGGGTLYGGLRETLDALRRRYRLYIVSNCQDGYIQAFLSAHGFGDVFDDYVRLAFTLEDKVIREGAVRIRHFLESL